MVRSRETEGPEWCDDVEAFLGDGESLALAPAFESGGFDELFDEEADAPVEHAAGSGSRLTAGKVGPKVDGTTVTAKIAIVAPASFGATATTDANRKTVKARFKARGHDVSLDYAPGAPFKAQTVLPQGTYELAGSDKERWEATKWGMFDAATGALICVRGGYGAMRFLWKLYEFVNYDASQAWKKPKRIAGYSDVTALLLASYSLMGWASIHGPMLVDSSKGDETLNSLVDALTKEPKDLYPGNLVSNTLEMAGTVANSSIRGVLLGGNLSLVEALYGSAFLPSLKGAILFLEETNEPEYRIDRMLEGLALRGILKDILAVVLGTFTDLTAKQSAALIAGSWGVPCAYGLKSGHSTPNLALWMGLEHELVIRAGKAELYLRP